MLGAAAAAVALPPDAVAATQPRPAGCQRSRPRCCAAALRERQLSPCCCARLQLRTLFWKLLIQVLYVDRLIRWYVLRSCGRARSSTGGSSGGGRAFSSAAWRSAALPGCIRSSSSRRDARSCAPWWLLAGAAAPAAADVGCARSSQPCTAHETGDARPVQQPPRARSLRAWGLGVLLCVAAEMEDRRCLLQLRRGSQRWRGVINVRTKTGSTACRSVVPTVRVPPPAAADAAPRRRRCRRAQACKRGGAGTTTAGHGSTNVCGTRPACQLRRHCVAQARIRPTAPLCKALSAESNLLPANQRVDSTTRHTAGAPKSRGPRCHGQGAQATLLLMQIARALCTRPQASLHSALFSQTLFKQRPCSSRHQNCTRMLLEAQPCKSMPHDCLHTKLALASGGRRPACIRFCNRRSAQTKMQAHAHVAPLTRVHTPNAWRPSSCCPHTHTSSC